MSAARWLSLLGVALLGLTACGSEEEATPAASDEAPSSDPEPAADDEASEPALSVVVTLAPVADLVGMVGGERVAVTSLVPSGADSHTYEPRPSDVATLSEADAFLGVGLDLNPGVVALAEQHLPSGSVHLLAERALDREALVHDHTHGDEADHSHDGGQAGHTHDGGEADHTHDGGEADHTHDDEQAGHAHADDEDEAAPNPHVWTSLRNAAALIDGIEATLSELDPDGAEAYATAAEEARSEIEALDAEIAAAVDTIPEEDRTLVAYHDAWTYFARDHGLEMVTAVQPSDYSEPSAAEVRELIDVIREQDVPAIFGSEVFPNDVLATIGEETGARYVDELADDVLPGEPGDPEHSYLALMRRNATAVVEGLGGDPGTLADGSP